MQNRESPDFRSPEVGRYVCALGRTVNTKYKTPQLISFARFTSRTQATGEPKL